MSNALYELAQDKIINADIDWTQDDIKAVLIDTADYTVDLVTDEFLSDIPSAAIVATSDNLTGKGVTAGVVTASPAEFSLVSGDTVEAMVVYQDSGVAATSPLICYIDTSPNFPITPSGGNIDVEFDANVVFFLENAGGIVTLDGPNEYHSAGALRINTEADIAGGGSSEGTIERVVGDQYERGSGVINWSHRGDHGFLMHLGIPLLRSDSSTQTAGGAQACIGMGVYGGNGLLVDVYEAGYGINIQQMASGTNNGYGLYALAANTEANGAKPLIRLASNVDDMPPLLEMVGGVGSVNPAAGSILTHWKTTISSVAGVQVGRVQADTGHFQWDKDVLPARLAVAAPISSNIAAVATWGTVEKLRVGTPTTVSNEAAVMLAADATTTVPLVLQAKAGQTAPILRIQSSAGASFIAVSSAGQLNLNAGMNMADNTNFIVGTTTGTKIGTGTTQKLGFWNATPVVQPTAVADATGAGDVVAQLNALLSRLRTIGIIST